MSAHTVEHQEQRLWILAQPTGSDKLVVYLNPVDQGRRLGCLYARDTLRE